MEDSQLSGAHWFVSPGERHSLGRARLAIHDLLLAKGVDVECRQRSVLVCDELLDNALIHTDGAVVVSVCVSLEQVRVSVNDQDPSDPATLGRSMTPCSGLTLVGNMSRAICVQAIGDGKSVTAEVTRNTGRPDDDGDGVVEPALVELL